MIKSGLELAPVNNVEESDAVVLGRVGVQGVEKVAVEAMEVVEAVEVLADLALGVELLEFADETL